MRLAFLSGRSVSDRRAWSGTIYYAHRALAKRFDVIPVETPTMNRALRGLRRATRSTGIDLTREPLCSSIITAHTARLVARTNADAVFVLSASHISAGLADHFPVFHCSDATFATMVDYHGEFSALSDHTVRAGNALERHALRKSAANILASDWAAESVRADYQRTAGVHVVPFGANLDVLPKADIWTRRKECSLVFIGVTWYAKGADVAVETVRILRERGIPAVLHVVGCAPPEDLRPMPFVRFHGFLRKQVPDEYARLTALVASADFLVLPTRFDAFGIVFCEAAAYGTPSIARQTGGVPTAIQDGITGALLPPQAGARCYASRIQGIWSDPVGYRQMRRNALARSRRTLNWDAWGNSVETIIHDTLAANAAASSSRGE
jgi:glycosyltransferase involved in cell wall biosynthesis